MKKLLINLTFAPYAKVQSVYNTLYWKKYPRK